MLELQRFHSDYLLGDAERERERGCNLILPHPHLLKNPFYRPLLSLVFQLLGHLSCSHCSYLWGERGEERLGPGERSQIRHLLPPPASLSLSLSLTPPTQSSHNISALTRAVANRNNFNLHFHLSPLPFSYSVCQSN